MQIPVEITFKEMESSAAVETRIRELAAKLPPGQWADSQDKRIVTALLKRLEKQPTADVILADT